MTFDEVLDAVERLSDDEKRDLLGILRSRLAASGRLRVIADVAESQAEFERGECKVTTPEELMEELTSE